MAYFHRLIFGCVLALCSSLSFASIPQTSVTTYTLATTAGSGTSTDAVAWLNAALAPWVTKYNGGPCPAPGSQWYFLSTGTTTLPTNWLNGSQTTQFMCGGGGQQFTQYADTALTCPSNSTLTAGACVCNSGFTQDGSVCTSTAVFDQKSCDAVASGLNYIKAPLVHYGAAGLTACFGGYVISGTGAASGGGQTELYGPFKCSGANASTCSVVPKPADITANCPSGSYPGTVNGVQVCVPPTSSTEAPKTTTAIPPTPGASAPQLPGAPEGTTTEEKQTDCVGPNCTITTTYKDPTGATTGSKTEVQSKLSYCAENPKAPGCESLEASTFGGACAGGFTFKGDAIQGALAKEVHKQNCIINDTSDESALYTTKRAIAEVDLTSTLPGNQTVSVGSGDFDASDAIGGAACITNKTVVVWGKTIVLPFSDVCPAMGYLKTILLAVSWLSAAGIVIGRKT